MPNMGVILGGKNIRHWYSPHSVHMQFREGLNPPRRQPGFLEGT
jgi:hypothetical protein